MGVTINANPSRFTSGQETQYPLCRRLGGVKRRAERVCEMSTPIDIRSLDRPACSKSLYRPRYLGLLNLGVGI